MTFGEYPGDAPGHLTSPPSVSSSIGELECGTHHRRVDQYLGAKLAELEFSSNYLSQFISMGGARKVWEKQRHNRSPAFKQL
ncbi:hypothetical protein DTO212C5_7231 [Paecilomyces variotii]|nr:hypothetical protein DTO212C5_7231 [Paecilomyces variotii]